MADADRGQLDLAPALDFGDDLAQVLFEIVARIAERVDASTGAPSEITIRMRRCSVRSSRRLCAQLLEVDDRALPQREFPARVGRPQICGAHPSAPR
jgi:hypothetical protein